MSYESTEEGTRSSLSKLNELMESVGNCQAEYEALNPELSRDEKIKARIERAKDFFTN